MRKGLIRVMIVMAAGLLLSTMCLGSAFAVEVKEEAKVEEHLDLGIRIKTATDLEVQAIKSEPMNILTVISSKVDLFLALFEKYIASGEPGILVLDKNTGLLMVDGIILDLNTVAITWGYAFSDNPAGEGQWGLGLKIRFDRIDLTKDIAILKDLRPGIGWYGNRFYLMFGIDLFNND